MTVSRYSSGFARVRNGIARRPALSLGLVLFIPAVLALGVVREGTSETSVLAVVLLSTLLLAALVTLSLAFAGVDPEVDELAAKLTTDPLSRQLLQRWLHRVRWRRWVTGFIGLVIGLFISSNVGEDLGSAAFIYPPVAGVCLASVSAELYLLRRTAPDTRTADLSTRDFADYINRRDQLALMAAFGAAVAVVAWSVLSSDLADRDWVMVWSLVAVVSVLAAHLMQRRVVGRRRPAVTADLREADDLLRSLAVSRGIARPAISFALITIGVALAPTTLEGFETVAWLFGLGCWWFNRGLGIERFLSSRGPGSTVAAA